MEADTARCHMAYQAAPRYHVSDMQSPDDQYLLEEELASGRFPNSRVKHQTAATAALLLVTGTLVAANALNNYKTATHKENPVGNYPQTVNLEAQPLLTCMACVRQGRSWQMGTCNPTKECLIRDQACYQDANGCKQRKERKEKAEAENVCKDQADCTSCVSSNRLCLWNGDAGCFMIADYWGPEHLVVRHGETCSAVPKTAEIMTTAEPEHGSSSESFLKSSRELLATCMACVGMGKSWQAGECNPSSECMGARIGCFQDASGCRRWYEEHEAAPTCEAQKDCSSCLRSSNLCVWQPHSGCFVGAGFFLGPPEAVVQHGERCPENKAAPLERAEVLKEPALMDAKGSAGLTRERTAGS